MAAISMTSGFGEVLVVRRELGEGAARDIHVALRVKGSVASMTMSADEALRVAAEIVRALRTAPPSAESPLIDHVAEDDERLVDTARSILVSADRQQEIAGPMRRADAEAFLALYQLNLTLQSALEEAARAETGVAARRAAERGLNALTVEATA